MVYVSGQLAFDESRQILGDTLRDQANICLDRIEALLARVGGDLNNVVRITTYLADLETYPDFDSVRTERFGESRPASTAVGVAGLLFGALVEIEAIAFLPDRLREEQESIPSTHS
jgi:2-iminobutanoate/2-iminopropanoate deaminase